MTYVLTCDRTFRETGLRLAGKDAALLHAVALHECAAVDGNGVLTPLMVKDAADIYDLKSRAKLAARLVEHGIWHDAIALDRCPECFDNSEPIGPDDFLIHRWWEPLLHSAGKHDAVRKARDARRKALNRDRALVARIRTRDRDLCRYCGVDTLDNSGPDKKSALVRTLDHVDPFGENSYANVVVACKRCNGWKNQRTPEAWLAAEGWWSLENPGGARDLLKPGTRSETDPADPTGDRGQDRASRAPAREAGPGRIESGRDGAGSGPASDRDPALGELDHLEENR